MQKNKYNSPNKQPLGMNSDQSLLKILQRHGISPQFPTEVQNAKIPSPQDILSQSYRVNRQDLFVFTIDGPDAKDLDDALSLEYDKSGNPILGVHIADASEYVEEGEIIDNEAIKRGTSIYPSNTVIPMLPEHISNDVCSLHPNTPKAVLSVYLLLNSEGEVQRSYLEESVIVSKLRLTYAQAQGYLEGVSDSFKPDNSQVGRTGEATVQAIALLMRKVQRNARKNGKISFSSSEKKVLWKNGKPVDIVIEPHLETHDLIESAMVLANEAVATLAARMKLPFLYRIHLKPSQEKFEKLLQICQELDLPKPKDSSHKTIAKFVENLSLSHPDTVEFLSRRFLECMEKAVYSPSHKGHYGLGLEFYSHFTSPIRRYPDLQIHRILKLWLHKELSHQKKEYYRKILSERAQDCTKCEIESALIEYEYRDYLSGLIMQDKIGQVFSAVITGMFGQLIFCELISGISVASYVPAKSGIRKILKRGTLVDFRIEGIDLSGRIQGKIILRSQKRESSLLAP